MTEDNTEMVEGQELPEEVPQEAPEGEEAQPEGKAGKEASRYRRRLRETEAERDALAGNVDALRRQIVEGLVTDKGRLGNPATLWETGTTLEELLTEDGTVDHQKVLDKCEDVAQRLRIARAPKGPYVPSEGRTTNPRGSQSWESAFSPK